MAAGVLRGRSAAVAVGRSPKLPRVAVRHGIALIRREVVRPSVSPTRGVKCKRGAKLCLGPLKYHNCGCHFLTDWKINRLSAFSPILVFVELTSPTDTWIENIC